MNYVRFDTVAFLKDSKTWGGKKSKLLQELEFMSELPSVNNESGVRSGKISKPAETMAMRRIKLKEQIEEIERNEEMLRYGMSTLTDSEKELVVGLYISDRRNGSVVWEWGRKHGLNKDYVYEELHKILREMGDKIEARFY